MTKKSQELDLRARIEKRTEFYKARVAHGSDVHGEPKNTGTVVNDFLHRIESMVENYEPTGAISFEVTRTE